MALAMPPTTPDARDFWSDDIVLVEEDVEARVEVATAISIMRKRFLVYCEQASKVK